MNNHHSWGMNSRCSKSAHQQTALFDFPYFADGSGPSILSCPFGPIVGPEAGITHSIISQSWMGDETTTIQCIDGQLTSLLTSRINHGYAATSLVSQAVHAVTFSNGCRIGQLVRTIADKQGPRQTRQSPQQGICGSWILDGARERARSGLASWRLHLHIRPFSLSWLSVGQPGP